MSETSTSRSIAPDAGQHSEQRHHHRAEAVAERRLCAGYGKERQTRRIEGQDEIAQPLLALGTGRGEKYHQPGDDRDSEVPPVPERRRRDRADQHVARDAPRGGRRARYDEHAEQVESVLDPGRRSAEGEHERAHQLEHHERARRVLLEPGQRFHYVFSAQRRDRAWARSERSTMIARRTSATRRQRGARGRTGPRHRRSFRRTDRTVVPTGSRDGVATAAVITSPDTPAPRSPGSGCPWIASAR